MKHSLLYPLLILAISPFAQGATTRTWTGFGTTGNWNTATNWSGNAVPVAGDDLVFPPTNLHLTNTNNLISAIALNSITLSGSNYVMSGNSITLTAGLTNNGPAGTTNNFLTIALATNQIFRCAANSTLILPVTSLGTNTLTFDCSGSILVNGVIFGNGSIEKTGAGLLVLAATNTYTGSTTVSQGTVRVQTAAALGATSGSTTVAAGAILELQNNITVAEPITLSGTLRNAAGTNLLSGAIALAAANSTALTEANTSLTLSNVLSGAGGLVKTGPGLLTLAGTNANTYSGATLVNEGTLLLNKPMNITAIPGLVTIGDSTGGANADIVRLAADNQIQAASSNVFTINSSGLLDLNDKNQGVGPLAGSGNLSLGSSTFATLTIIAEDVSTNFSGVISGSGAVTKTGFGIQTLSGNNTYTGRTLLFSGTLFVNGSQPGSPVVFQGGVLGGSGTCGPITNIVTSGAIKPGASPGILNVSGEVKLTNTMTLFIELNGLNAGADYDQLNVTGGVNLASCALNVTLGFTPAIGDNFIILKNDGIDLITNTFAGLPEGAEFFVATTKFSITYTGGEGGNDVVLTVVPLVSGVTRTWTGAGSNNSWNNASNWVGNLAPVAGDDLVFPAGAARLSNFNDLAAATTFNSITFSGSDYLIDGNAITLNAYLSNSSPALTTNTLNCSLSLGGSRTVTVVTNSTLNLGGVISGSGGTMSKDGPGTLTLTGANANTYSGAIDVIDGTLALNKSAGNAIAGSLFIGDGLGTDRVLLLSSNQISDSAAIFINASGVLSLNGNDETIGPLSMNDGGLVDSGSGTLTLNGDVTRPLSQATTLSSITGKLSLGGTNRTFTINPINGHSGLTALEISAVISDGSATAGVTKAGAGILLLCGSNTYGGPSVIAAGTLTVSNANGLGAIGGGTIVSNGATLGVAGGIQVDESVVTLAGTLESFAGTNRLTGTILLGSNDSTVRVDSGKLNLFSAIGGTGGVLKDGPGDLEFSGFPNTYTGTTTVSSGTLLLNKAPGTIAIPGPLVVSGTVRSLANEQITNSAPLTVNASGLLDLNGFTETIGSLAGPSGGSVTLSNGSLIAGGNNDSTAFAGIISGSGGKLTKLGFGTMTLAGNNSYSGTTFASQGTLFINGTQPGSAVSVNGGTLGGTGTVGRIDLENGSTVSPGASPGILNSSNFTFGSGIATLSIELDGTTPGTGYDQLNVNGTVALNGLTFNASLGFTPALGDSFTIINNDGSDQIIGTFGGLPEGTFFSIGGTSFRITYSGGAGSNDVVLTRADVPPTNVPPSTITSIIVLSNKQALLQGAGVSNATYTIQANTNLTTTNWPNIGQAQANGSGAFSFTDTNAPSFNQRFYRVLSP